jgi:DNA invertase Pin-like site-specific DNA recombinase
VLYERVSDVAPGSTAIIRQDGDLTAFADNLDVEVPPGMVLVDDGVSGRVERDAANRALQALRDGEVDVLIAWSLDRFGRGGLQTAAAIMKVLEERPDAQVIFIKDNLRSGTPAFEMVLGVLASMARMEADRVSMRVKSSIAYLRRDAHRWSGGAVPYGYRPAPHPGGKGRTLVLDPDEVVIVDEVADRLIAGEKRWTIARDLNDRGVPTARSAVRMIAQGGRRNGGRVAQKKGDDHTGQWSTRSVQHVWRGVALLGFTTYHGRVILGDDGLPVQVYPAAIDSERWLRLQAIIPTETPSMQFGKWAEDPGQGVRKARREQQHRRAARLLSGLVRCGECGRPMYVHGVSKKSHTPRYVCSSKSNGFTCPGVGIDALALESYASTVCVELLGDVNVTRTIESAVNNADALGAVEQAINATVGRMAEDDGDDEALAAELTTRLGELKRRRAKLREESGARTVTTVSLGRLGDLWRALADDAVDERRRLIGSVISGFNVFAGQGQLFTLERVMLVPVNDAYRAALEESGNILGGLGIVTGGAPRRQAEVPRVQWRRNPVSA